MGPIAHSRSKEWRIAAIARVSRGLADAPAAHRSQRQHSETRWALCASGTPRVRLEGFEPPRSHRAIGPEPIVSTVPPQPRGGPKLSNWSPHRRRSEERRVGKEGTN